MLLVGVGRLSLGFLIGGISLLVIFGCQAPLAAKATDIKTVRSSKVTAGAPGSSAAPKHTKRVTNRKPDMQGSVLILEYHKFTAKEERWGRTPKNFRTDLERLYKAGFRPVTLIEYLEGRIDIPPGSTPVIFTFDDSAPSQYSILPTGEIDPNCAVGIWRKFAQTRPDFPLKATFFVLPEIPFGQKASAKQKLTNLRKWGSEIGVHTLTHRSLATLTDEEVKKEIGGSIKWLDKLGYKAETMALPYGVLPKNKALLKGFDWKGQKYALKGYARVGAVPAPAPGSSKLNPYNIPRIQGIGIDYGLTWWLKKINAGKVRLYVQP